MVIWYNTTSSCSRTSHSQYETWREWLAERYAT